MNRNRKYPSAIMSDLAGGRYNASSLQGYTRNFKNRIAYLSNNIQGLGDSILFKDLPGIDFKN